MGKRTNHSTTKKLSRAQVAKVLGVQDYEVAAMDGKLLHPTRAKNRVWHYDVDEVGAVMQKRSAALSKASAEPDGASQASVFALFAAKKSVPKVVVATKQPLSVVADLRHKYDEWQGSITITASGIRQLCALLGQEFHTSHELYPAVRRALEARLEEGRADCLEFGEVTDPVTGKLRPVGPKKTTTEVIAANSQEGATHGDGK